MTAKTCGQCQGVTFRRVNRRGWLQRIVLPKLGFYPWECVQCRTRRFFRDSGPGTSHRAPTFR